MIYRDEAQDDEASAEMATLLHPQTGEPVDTASHAHGDKLHDQSTTCEICHLAVGYIRAALANNATEQEIEQVRTRYTVLSDV